MKLIKEYATITKVDAARTRGWTHWDIVREFVQNALDEVGKAGVSFVGRGLVITDLGAGFDATAFLIGETTKSPPKCYRGQFGDGLKMAILTALLYGYEITIKSKGYMYIPRIKDTEFVVEKGIVYKPTLLIEQYEIEPVVGTEVRIKNWEERDYRENFILYDDKDSYKMDYIEDFIYTAEECPPEGKIYHRCIMLPAGSLFVKDILVNVDTLKRALYSYNLVDIKMGVDRNIASESDVSREIMKLWSPCNDTDLLVRFIKGIKKPCYEQQLPWVDFPATLSDYMRPNLDRWMEAIRRVYPRAFREGVPMFYYPSAGYNGTKRVEYYAAEYIAIPLPKPLLGIFKAYDVILSDLDIIKRHRSTAYKIIPDDTLDDMQREVLSIIRAISVELCKHESIEELRMRLSPEEPVKVIQKPDVNAFEHEDPSVVGRYSPGDNQILIGVTRLFRCGSAIESLSHEFVHTFYRTDTESNTFEFVTLQNAILLEIMHILVERKVKIRKGIVW